MPRFIQVHLFHKLYSIVRLRILLSLRIVLIFPFRNLFFFACVIRCRRANHFAHPSTTTITISRIQIRTDHGLRSFMRESRIGPGCGGSVERGRGISSVARLGRWTVHGRRDAGAGTKLTGGRHAVWPCFVSDTAAAARRDGFSRFTTGRPNRSTASAAAVTAASGVRLLWRRVSRREPRRCRLPGLLILDDLHQQDHRKPPSSCSTLDKACDPCPSPNPTMVPTCVKAAARTCARKADKLDKAEESWIGNYLQIKSDRIAFEKDEDGVWDIDNGMSRVVYSNIVVDRLVYVLLLTSGCFSYDDINENRRVVKFGGCCEGWCVLTYFESLNLYFARSNCRK